MAITGLPDPAIHRKCKRCGGWFHAHEGALCWPPRTGLLSWVHVTMAESSGLEREMKFYCADCQQRNATDERRARRVAVQMVLSLLVLGVAGLAAWALGLGEWLDHLMRGG